MLLEPITIVQTKGVTNDSFVIDWSTDASVFFSLVNVQAADGLIVQIPNNGFFLEANERGSLLINNLIPGMDYNIAVTTFAEDKGSSTGFLFQATGKNSLEQGSGTYGSRA